MAQCKMILSAIPGTKKKEKNSYAFHHCDKILGEKKQQQHNLKEKRFNLPPGFRL